MNRLMLTSVVAAITVVSIVAAALAPTSGVHAAAQVHTVAKDRVVSWGRPTIAIDKLGPGKSDAELGFPTHWECQTALDNPNDPFTCVRVKGANAALATVASGAADALAPNIRSLHPGQARLAARDAAHPSRRAAGVSVTPCIYTGGILIFQDAGFANNCARFTGTGELYLRNVNFPGTSTSVGDNASSLSTIGSMGHGALLCPNGVTFPFAANSQYTYIGDSCNDNVDWLDSE